MAGNDFQYGGWNYYTLQCVTIMTLISSGDCTLQCGMWLWNHDSEFTKCQQPAMWYVALGWQAIEFAWWQHPTMWQMALGWHAMEFAQISAVLEFYIWFRFWPYHRSRHVIMHQSAKFLSKSDHPQQKDDVLSIFKMVDLRHLGFQGLIMGSLKSACTTSRRSSVNRDHSSKLYSFWENHFFCISATDRQTNIQTYKQMDSIDTLSRSRRCCERRLNNYFM